MKYYKISTPVEVKNYIFSLLEKHLATGEKVLWLLSGGSFITIEIEVAKNLAGLPNLANLSVSLIDERYGETGHKNSNWQQLFDSGFKLPDANLIPVLNGQDMAATAETYEDNMKRLLGDNDFKLGLAGIGPDGHTLGIKLGSPALDSKNLVEAYDWEDYRRITATAELIKHLDEVVVYALGPEKKKQLRDLKNDLPASEQPAQALKFCPKVAIFTDQDV